MCQGSGHGRGSKIINRFRILLKLPPVAGDTIVVEIMVEGRRVGPVRVEPAILQEFGGLRLHAVVHDVMPLELAAEAHRQMDVG